MLLLLVACDEPGPGEAGYQACEPVEQLVDPADPVNPYETCLIWQCYRVITRENVAWWLEDSDRARYDDTYEGLRSAVYAECARIMPEVEAED